MRACLEYEILITAAASDELTPEEAEGFWKHLERCEACRAALAEERKLLALVERCRGLEIPTGLASRVAEGARARRSAPARSGRARRFPGKRLVWIAAAAAGLLLLVGVARRSRREEAIESVAGAVTVGRGGRATTTDGTGELVLAGGSRVALSPNTSLRTLGRRKDVRQALELDAGKIEIEAKKAEGMKAVRVTTPVGEATALGTHFTVELKKLGEEAAMFSDKVKAGVRMVMVVTVIEGAVLVSNTDGKAHLDPGGVAYAAETAAPVAGAEGNLESAFPADALAAAMIEAPDRLEKRFRETAIGKVYFNADFQAAIAGSIAKAEGLRKQGVAKIRETGFLDPDALQKAVKGRFGLALLGMRKIEGQGEPAADLLFAAEAPDREAYEKVLSDFVIVVQANMPEARFVGRDVRGVEVRTLQAPAGAKFPYKISYAYCRGLFLVSLDADGTAVEAAVGRVLDGAPGLASAKGVARITERLGRAPDVIATGNVSKLFDFLKEIREIKGRNLLEARLTGATSFNRLTYALAMDGLEFREFFVAETGKREGLAKLLDIAKPLPADAFGRVPASALAAFGLSCESGKIFETLCAGADAVDPENGRRKMELDDWDKIKEAMGLDFKGLFAALRGDVVAYVTMSQAVPLPELAIVAPLKDEAAAKAVFAAIRDAHAAAGRDVIAAQPYAGGILYTAPGQGPMQPCYGVANGCIVFGSNAQAAKRAAKFALGAPAPLSGADTFKGVMGKLPAGAAVTGYLDAKRTVELGYNALMPFLQAKHIKQNAGIDAARLPLADEVVKDFTPIGSALVFDADGFASEARGPLPLGSLQVLSLGAFYGVQEKRQEAMEMEMRKREEIMRRRAEEERLVPVPAPDGEPDDLF